jgi:hypothetical protein
MTWIKNTSGKPDAILTLSMITLGVVLIKFFLSEVAFGRLVFGSIDGGTIAALLTPTLGSYCARRWTDANSPQTNKDSNNAK